MTIALVLGAGGTRRGMGEDNDAAIFYRASRLSAATVMSGGAVSAMAQTPAPAAAPFTLTSPKHQDGAFLDKHFAGPSVRRRQRLLAAAMVECAGEYQEFRRHLARFRRRSGFRRVHWIAYGIAPDVTSLAEGEGTNPSPRLTGGSNTRKWATYYGPCAPATGSPHHYIYSIYALDVPKDELPGGLTRDQFLDRVKGRVLGLVSLVSMYRRPK